MEKHNNFKPMTGTICCSACIWTNIPSSNKMKTKYKKLKIIMCTCGWGKLWTWYEETKIPTATFEEQEAKARHCASPLCTISPKKWANYLSHPSRWALDPPCCLVTSPLSPVWLSATQQTIAQPTRLLRPWNFPGNKYCSGLTFPSPDLPDTPAVTPYKEPTCPTSGSKRASKQGNLLFVFPPLCCSMSPSNNALSKFLDWPLINLDWLRRPRTLVSNVTDQGQKQNQVRETCH